MDLGKGSPLRVDGSPNGWLSRLYGAAARPVRYAALLRMRHWAVRSGGHVPAPPPRIGQISILDGTEGHGSVVGMSAPAGAETGFWLRSNIASGSPKRLSHPAGNRRVRVTAHPSPLPSSAIKPTH